MRGKPDGQKRSRPQRGVGKPRGGAGRPRRAKTPSSESLTADQFPMRLNRFIARSGVCSRREADELIQKGLVKVDGKEATDFSTQVDQNQRVEVNGKVITPVEGVYLLLNKPSGVITTTSDERGRQTVLDLVDLPDNKKSALFPVGRLDRETTGVLIITSDGELAHRLMHPSFEMEKLYRVRTTRSVTDEELDRLTEGLELEDGKAVADQAAFINAADRSEVAVAMHSGRNRIVRRMFEALGHEVKELERVRYAGLTSSGVRRGKWRRLTEKEVRRLYKVVKMKQ